MYPEYTGTGLLVLLQPTKQEMKQLGGDKQAVYNFVKEQFKEKYNLQWLQPIGFNNAYALMMRQQQAKEESITTISDLKSYLDK